MTLKIRFGTVPVREKRVKSIISAKLFATKEKIDRFSLFERSDGVWVKILNFRKVGKSWKDVSEISIYSTNQ